MKKYLISESGNFYKANLHCHTVCSDGRLTPQQVKEHYMAHGYSVVAFTDHDVLLAHPELKSDDFLPLNGFEVEVDQPTDKPYAQMKTCHMCFVAKEPDNLQLPFYHRSRYLFANAVTYRHLLQYDDTKPDYVRSFTHEGISEMMRMGREAGFFVTYNHPTWSLEDYSDYMGYEGMHAMEIMNFGCWVNGYLDYNPRVYDDLLRLGRRIYAVATDDNHYQHDMCGGWTMIKAPKLEYRAITNALERGDFYASWGPEIHELWYEDGYVHVRCSEAGRILCTYGARRTGVVTAEEGSSVTEAAFPVRENDVYLRITVEDKRGRCADTNAYFVNDLL